MTNRTPNLPADVVLQRIQELSRSPWQEQLAALMRAAPTDEELRQYAREHVRDWVWSMSALATLAGYRTGSEARSAEGVHIHVGSGSRVAIGVGSDGRIVDPAAYRAALVRELGPEVASRMLARLDSRQPVTLEQRQDPAPGAEDALETPPE